MDPITLDPPAPGIHRVMIPRRLSPAPSFLRPEVCRDLGLFNWVEIHTDPGLTLEILVTLRPEEWLHRRTTNAPSETGAGAWIWRVPLSLTIEPLWDLTAEVSAGLSLQLLDGSGRSICPAIECSVSVSEVNRCVITRGNIDAVDPCRALAVFVTPGDPTVRAFLDSIGGFSGGSGAGRLSGDATSVPPALDDARTLYRELQRRGVGFLTTELSACDRGVTSQLVQFPAQTLRAGSGNCLDGAVLFAALLERLGHRPKIAILRSPGHALVGWRNTTSARDFTLLDVTRAAAGDSFEEALNHAARRMTNQNGAAIIDLLNLRRDGVTPFPWTVPDRSVLSLVSARGHGDGTNTLTSSSLFEATQFRTSLRVVHSPDTRYAGWSIPVAGSREIGRDAHANGATGFRGEGLRFADPRISGQHTVLSPIPGSDTLQVRDLRSKNGCWLNGARVFLGTLDLQDVLRIGDTLLVLSPFTWKGDHSSQDSLPEEATVPLLERRQDILCLWSRAADPIPDLKPSELANLLEALLVYNWPGDLRELDEAAAAYRHAVASGRSGDLWCLPEEIVAFYRHRRKTGSE